MALIAACAGVCAAQTTVGVTFNVSPTGVYYVVDGGIYTTSETFSWTVGTSHTVYAVSPQFSSAGTTEYFFSSWSDGGSLGHTVTASSSTTSYTVNYSSSYLLQISANNSNGTYSPRANSYYGSGTSVSISATANSGYYLEDWTGSSDVVGEEDANTKIKMNGPEAIVANFKKYSGGIIYIATPVYIVTTTADDASGNYNNCPIDGPFGSTGLNCTLRDALAAAANIGFADIYFSSTVFASTNTAAQNTIALQYGPLAIPQSTIVSAPLAQNGSSVSDLVTVSGGGSSGVFSVASGITDAEVDNLTITGGLSATGGGGIYNDGALTLTNDTISGNSAAGVDGGGIYNDSDGNLTILACTISSNSADTGGGIADYGTMTLTDSTISGNSATTLGGGLDESGTATLTSVTVSSNQSASGNGGGVAILSGSGLTVSDSIISGNGVPTADVDGSFTDAGGNILAQGTANLAPLGNYGGATQTQIPLPGSPAICQGLTPATIVVGEDQRGFPNINTTYPGYSGTTPCVDVGAVQTNYSVTFSGEPAPISPATSILTGTSFGAAVTLDENGSPFSQAVTIPLTLTGTGSLSGGSVATVNGVATYSALQVDAADGGDALTANVQLNPPQAPTQFGIATSSNSFSVVSVSTTTAAASAAAPFSAGAQSVQLIASVGAASQTVDAGTVTFTVLAGSTMIGAPVTSGTVSGGTASVNYILPAGTTPGTYTIQAVYNADGAFTASSDNSHTLTIAKSASATAITSSTGNANLNASLTLTAIVTGAAAATPTGSVEFMDGSQALGSGTLNAQGAANYPTTNLAAGVHLITAVYSGDADFAGSTSAQYVQTVTSPNYTLTANPTSLTLSPGQTGQVTFTFAPVGGFTGAVNFSCVGLPNRSTCAFAPASLTANGSNTTQTTTMTISTEGDATGTVARNSSGQSPSGPTLARLFTLPALFFGIFLVWQRRRLRRSGCWLAVALLAVALSGLAGCGGSTPSTALGTFT
ncbi:MAG: Ig-like domain repeat protein, partial [Terracidiphilus sp.]